MGCLPSKAAGHAPDTVLDDGQFSVAATGSSESNARTACNNSSASHHVLLTSTPKASETPVMQKVKIILQQVLLLSSEGVEACDQAAELLLTGLDGAAELISLTACSNRPGVAVLVAAQGTGASALLQQQLVMAGSSWSPGWLVAQPQLPQVLYRTAATDEEAAGLPKDWELLYREAGLKTFLAVPVTAHGSMLGVLGLASSQAGAFWEYWWEPLLSIVCTGLVRLLRSPIMSCLVELIVKLGDTHNTSTLMTTLLQGSTTLLESYTNMVLGVRLGLLSPDQQQVMIMHSKRYGRSSRPGFGQQAAGLMRSDSPSFTAAAGAADEDVALLRIAATNTLLLDAATRRVARFVRNTVAYLEGVSEPSHDVFIEDDDVVSSIVVAPLLVGDQPYGALYVTHALPWSQGPGFTKCKAAIVGLAGLLQRLLATHVAGQHSRIWQELIEAHARRTTHGVRLDPDTPRAASSISTRTHSSDWQASVASTAAAAVSNSVNGLPSSPAAAAGADAGASPAAAQSQLNQQAGVQAGQGVGLTRPDRDGSLIGEAPLVGSGVRETVATSSMVEMLRLQVQRSKDRQRNTDNSAVEELQLHSLLGKGGFGSVFSGTWKGSPAAIKVMYVQQHERQLMKNAMEMAVLTIIRHPNIVRVYACLTDMVEEAVPGAHPSPDSVARRFTAMRDGSLAEGCSSLCNIVVMEICDRGNLRQAMRRGLLHKRTANKGLVVDMRLLVTVLLEVARSIQHLHTMQVIHCDVKAENVLLKSSSASPMGFVCKLGDFGLVKLLLGKYYVTNRSGSGTVTHLAPELFEAGSKVTSAVDSYAFGIMMWELYSCQRLYAGMGAECIVKKVLRQQGRPQFPDGTPSAYQQLAVQCWAQSKDDRPSFDVIVAQLQGLLDAAGGPFTCTASSTASSASSDGSRHKGQA